MLELSKKKHSDKLAPAELQRLERQIADTDAEIDDLVYDLYGHHCRRTQNHRSVGLKSRFFLDS